MKKYTSVETVLLSNIELPKDCFGPEHDAFTLNHSSVEEKLKKGWEIIQTHVVENKYDPGVVFVLAVIGKPAPTKRLSKNMKLD